MSLTVVANLFSIAYPAISNRIRVDLATQADPSAIVVSEIDANAGHPARIWSFPGLPRTNYVVTMNEIDASGNPINNLAFFDFVPDQISGAMVRDDEQIFPGITTGVPAGVTHITFDGTGGAPDYRGWNINPERRSGGGTMIRNQEYTWNTLTGDFDLLITGDVTQLGELINIDFDPIQSTAGGSTSSSSAFTTRIVNSNDFVLLTDFGNKIIAEPLADFMTLQLPDISTVTANLPLMVECSKSSNCCVELVSFGSDIISFAYGRILLCRGESLRVYKLVRSAGIYEFRVDQADGNFKTVGQIIDIDQVPTGIVNAIQMNGASLSTSQYARLFDYVNRLPSSQVVAFSLWSTGTNSSKFSYSSGGIFKIPLRAGMYKRNINGDLSGVFYRMMMEYHKHGVAYAENPDAVGGAPFGSAGFRNKRGNAGSDSDNDWWFTNDGQEFAGGLQMNVAGAIGPETRPNSYSINQLLLI